MFENTGRFVASMMDIRATRSISEWTGMSLIMTLKDPCSARTRLDQWIREVSFTQRPGSVRPRKTSHREDHYIVRNPRVQPTASSAALQAQITSSLGVPESSRTIRRRLAERHLGSWRPLRVLPLTPIHRRLRLERCRTRGNWTAVEWNQVVFSDESIFNLRSYDNPVRVWRPRGKRLNPVFAQQRCTTLTAGVMAWGAIA
ncbi:transposable element Tcb2 transposase [Trichonephila clavipes]|uniref:Transposable element Tcb2 transposase n=1 Tax=Trichonephila clavipes TaxID=2585209 RepID=A0A8X6RGT0_TRICX|nr:transposable element Tcb2 transposase [Trichonephila clavipes]